MPARLRLAAAPGLLAARARTAGPDQVPGLIGWFDAATPETLSLGGADVIANANRVPGGPGLTAVGAGGPAYAPTGGPGGRPALLWPDAPNNLGLSLAKDAQVAELFVVCQFAGGTTATWPTYNAVFSSRTAVNECTAVGEIGKSHLAFGNAGQLVSSVSINGAPFGSAMLPLPLSILHFSASTESLPHLTLAAFGFQHAAATLGRSWRGPICEVLAYLTALTPNQRAHVQAYLTRKWRFW
ncbi:hypothetical protein [Palleronia caenipelagi]|uniref:Uncharacterized protein n=1 Tax=Palleronia caenipelagi TaxID=2489174 RepID=A0A547PJH1_9RHOB|nr:hypothetical protein [Palleronia caenipelagi]TRD14316.1 hypothetical protein FEV53_19210 [Palleronia caenipelagi]